MSPFQNVVMKAKMTKQSISTWTIPPVEMNRVPSFRRLGIHFLIEPSLTQAVSSAELSCRIPRLLCFLFAERPVLFFLALPDATGLQPSSSSWGGDAPRNPRERHLRRLTFGPGSARPGLNASLRANPGEQEIISFWPTWSSEVHCDQLPRPGQWDPAKSCFAPRLGIPVISGGFTK